MTVFSIRVKINDGSEEFQITGRKVPAFLYEDLDVYDPDDILSGLMRGYFLIWVHGLGFCEASTDLITVLMCHIHEAKGSLCCSRQTQLRL
jgi:hypothetical protein